LIDLSLPIQDMDDRAMQMRSRMRVDGAISSYDGGVTSGRYGGHAVGLGQAGRSRSNPYGGYSDTEAMGPAASDRYYGRDPYYDGRTYDDGYGPYYNDRRAAAPPPPPRDRDFAASGDPYRQPVDVRRGPLRAPPGPMDPMRTGEIMGSGGHLGPRHPAEFFDSDMESVTSAFSSQSAPHARGKRPG
jgi:hypothetical protein